MKPYETETQQLRPNNKVSGLIITEVQKHYDKQDIKKAESEGYLYKCEMPTYAMVSKLQVKGRKDAIMKVCLPDNLVAEAHFHTDLRKTETLSGNGWIKRVGDQLAMDQTPGTIGDYITAKARKWKETMEAEHGKSLTTFIHKCAQLNCENQFREDMKDYATHLINTHGIDIT